MAEMTPEATAATSAPIRGRRADARLNMDAIVRSAAELLAQAPRASMGEVAAAAGLHRATVHRHFPARDDLLAAVRDHAFDVAMTRMREDSAAEGAPLEVLERLVRGQLEINDRFRLYRYAAILGEDRREVDRPDRLRPLTDVLARAQVAGDVRTDIDASALSLAVAGLITTTLPELAQGRMTHDEALDFCLRLVRVTA